MKKSLLIGYILVVLFLVGLSYGFLDLNLTLTHVHPVADILEGLRTFARSNRPLMAMLWFSGLVVISIYYIVLLRLSHTIKQQTLQSFGAFLVCVGVIVSLSYPAHSYDLFNYITTAKVTFYYHENPYVVMPIELLHEPNLAFTRAANKVALYGPVWILLSAVPHYLGAGNIWGTILFFKLTNTIVYLLFSYFIYRATASIKNVIFFACNPLVLMEVLIGGHNDIFMMALALTGAYVWYHHRKPIGLMLLLLSALVKGLTVVFLPLLFIRNIPWEKFLRITYWIVLGIFFVVAPLREELYPWYAVWFISVVSLLPFSKNDFTYRLTIVLSFALELRHLPYMWMGYYEGPGPMARLLLTVVPIGLFLCVYILNQYKQTKLNNL